MKANELMIGDWVKFPIGNERIIDLPYIMGKGICASFAASATLFPVEVEKLEPTPLTPEILEKNGFTHSFGDSDFYDYEKWEKKVDDKTIRVIKDHDGWFCRVDDIELTRSMGIVTGVHTMQNIIRIGGIDETIVV